MSVIFTPFCLTLKYLNWLRIDPLEEEVGMDISRHKGPCYESEGSAKAEAIMELSQSRRNLMNTSNSSSGKGFKSFKRDKPVTDAEPQTTAPEDKAVEDMA